MMEIQWFPGHMTKSMRMMEESVKRCDGVIYVVDARAPFACVNANLFKIFANKPVLIAVNKSDLVSSLHLEKIVSNLKKEGFTAVCVNGTVQKEAAKIYSAVVVLLAEKINKNKEKGVNKPLRMMVAGIPNTGKSTVINSLCGEKRAVTGNKAGVTRGKQWIRLKDIELLDTPGTMPPKFENQYYAKHLGYIGSINDDILDFESLCLEFIGELRTNFPNELKEKYNLSDISGEPLSIFEEICKKRGYLFRGGEYDYTRGARAIFDDFRKGRIGKICLETERYEQ